MSPGEPAAASQGRASGYGRQRSAGQNVVRKDRRRRGAGACKCACGPRTSTCKECGGSKICAQQPSTQIVLLPQARCSRRLAAFPACRQADRTTLAWRLVQHMQAGQTASRPSIAHQQATVCLCRAGASSVRLVRPPNLNSCKLHRACSLARPWDAAADLVAETPRLASAWHWPAADACINSHQLASMAPHSVDGRGGGPRV